MSLDHLPQPGTWLRPVSGWFGPLSYSYEVISRHHGNALTPPGTTGISLRRWGVDRATGQPVDDGRCSAGYSLSRLQVLTPGRAWRHERDDQDDEPMNYETIDRQPLRGQLELFA